LVAVLAIGIFALPSTIAMFGGQHNWYNLAPSGNDVPCQKCHADIYEEMNNPGPHNNMECWYCHRTGNLTGYTYASGDGTGSLPGEEAHAASTVDCMECHYGFDGTPGHSHPTEWGSEVCQNCHGITVALAAGGFGLTENAPGAGGDNTDTGSDAAHMAFVWGANGTNSTLMEGTNEACITCHTHVAIDINWTHAYKMSLDAVQNSTGDWNVGNFRTEGTYNVSTYGNMTGGNTGATDPVVEISPEPEGYVSGQP
ncbi:MAG: cytochrome c3 family protein, partial [Halobacteriota archaeon]|nr:cytochrome c3 family protein [Halobacteriota archaeon]